MATPDKAAALAALAANGGKIRRTARQLGMPESTLRSWSCAQKTGAKADPEPERDLLPLLRDIAFKLAGDLACETKRANASLRDLAVAFGIVMDKAERLEDLRRERERDDPLAGLIQTIAASRREQDPD